MLSGQVEVLFDILVKYFGPRFSNKPRTAVSDNNAEAVEGCDLAPDVDCCMQGRSGGTRE